MLSSIISIFFLDLVMAQQSIPIAVTDLDRPAITQELVDMINNDPNRTWVAGFGEHFINATLRDVQMLCGAKMVGGSPNITLQERVYSERNSVPLPDHFDWRDRSSMCPSILEIRDQANCGSCWALGSVSPMTDRICIMSKGSSKPRLSAQDVTSCSDPIGCDGGAPVSAWKYFMNTGIVTGGAYGDHSMCFSYQRPKCSHHSGDPTYPPCPPDPGTTPKCTKTCEDGEDWTVAKVRNTQDSYFLDGERALMQDIVQKGPITVVFDVLDDFPAYRHGIYDPNSFKSLGGHAVSMYGYGVENGVKYWLIKNSWNEKWGENGWFRMVRGKNACAIEGGLNVMCRPTAADVKIVS